MNSFLRKFHWLMSRGKKNDELKEEIQFHLDEETAQHQVAGLTEEDARLAARRDLGNVALVQENVRAAWGWTLLEQLGQDMRYALRGMRKNPGFTSVAVLSLALGIGANTAIFSLIDALLLRWLPVRNPQELVQMQMMLPGAPAPSNFSYPLVQALSNEKETLSSVCGFSNAVFDVGPTEAPETVTGTWLTGACHEMFGLVPVAGRLFTPGDDQPGAPPVVVITDGYWNRKFGRDPRLIGGQIVVSGVTATVIGVSPPDFGGATIGEVADFALPIGSMSGLVPDSAPLQDASTRWLHVLARPRPRVLPAQIKAHFAVTWPNLVRSVTPESVATTRGKQLNSTIEVAPGGTGWSSLRNQFSQPLLVLMALVGLILLICCANVANLLLARATSRRREIALRLAIGAGRQRLVRQFVTESILLSLLGTILAIGLASFGSRVLVAMLSVGQEGAITLDLNPNWRVLGFITLLAFGTGLAFGIVPALRASSIGPAQVLNGASTRIAASRSGLGAALVIAQVVLALPLVIGAGLFLRSLQNLRSLDAGFRRDGVVLIDVDGRKLGYRGPQLTGYYQELLRELEAIPGVTSASFSQTTPIGTTYISQRIAVSNQPAPASDTKFNRIGPRYFETLHTSLVAGREFTAGDTMTAPSVAIANQAFVREHLQGLQPIGQHISINGAANAEMEIVGVVQNAVYESLRELPPPTVYVPFLQRGGNAPAVFEIDTRASLAQLTAPIRARIQPKFPGSPIRIRTLSEQIESSLVRERLVATLAGCFGVVALLLAAVGLYGLLAYSVARRTPEMGIRMALGAERHQVLWMITRDAGKLVLAGIALGVPVAMAASRLISSMLFGLSASDPATMLGATTLLMLAGLLAALLPAYRASRVDPLVALRNE